MEYYNQTLCISYSELTAGIMTESYAKALKHRGQMKQVRRACYGTSALFEVNSLPLKYKTEVYKRFPDLKAQAEAKPFIETIEPDGEAIRFYEEYTLSDGRHLPYDKQVEYANNCAVMNAFKHRLESANSHRSRQSKAKVNKTDFWRLASQALPRIADKYPHSLPENVRRLQTRFNQYLKGGYEVFISGKYLNNNAAKVDDDVKESVLTQIISDRRNLDNEQIRALYNMLAENMNWHKISASTVAVWREKYDLITAAGRLGATNFRNNRTMQVKRSKPTAPLLYWTMDGWDVELLYQQTETNANGKSYSTYHNRLTVVVVLDPCVNYPIGYAIGSHETPELIKEALRNATNHTAELFGRRYRTNQLQCDHYAFKTLSPLYGVMGDKVTPARVKNAKAKVVEPYFGRLNKKYCQFTPNWSGFGITSDKNKQPNVDALNKYRHSFPDAAGCREQISRIIQAERADKVKRYTDLWAKLPEDRKLHLSDEQYLLSFGAETGFKNAIEGGGLRPRIEGIKREYVCFDRRFLEYSHVKWTVKYDPDNLSQVLAVNDDNTLRFTLESKYVQPMALADRKPGDAKQLERVHNFNKQLEGHITERLALGYEKTTELFAHNPQLNNTLARLVICDSNGQHKNERNAIRRAKPVDVKAIEVHTVANKQATDIDAELTDLY